MSLARAFTTRKANKPSIDVTPQRSNTTTKHGYSGSIRNKISGPMELTHTTNMLAYNAPDLYPKSASSTTSSTRSDDEDDAQTNISSPPTSPDVPNMKDHAELPGPNHLSCYFTAPGQKTSETPAQSPPVIPQRAPSHTKKASFEALARHQSTASRTSSVSGRSLSSKASFSLSRASSTSTQATSMSGSYSRKPSMTSLNAPPMPAPPPAVTYFKKAQPSESHPFGHELAQVSEIAEEFGLKERLNGPIDEEEQELLARGLLKFRAEDYLSEIQGLFSTFFTPEPRQVTAAWI